MDMIRHQTDLRHMPVCCSRAFDQRFDDDPDHGIIDEQFAAMSATGSNKVDDRLIRRDPNGNPFQVLAFGKFFRHTKIVFYLISSVNGLSVKCGCLGKRSGASAGRVARLANGGKDSLCSTVPALQGAVFLCQPVARNAQNVAPGTPAETENPRQSPNRALAHPVH